MYDGRIAGDVKDKVAVNVVNNVTVVTAIKGVPDVKVVRDGAAVTGVKPLPACHSVCHRPSP